MAVGLCPRYFYSAFEGILKEKYYFEGMYEGFLKD